MNINQIVLIAIKVMLVVLYGYTYYRFKRAQTMDNTLKLKLKGRGLIETVVIAGLNVLFLTTPHHKETAGLYVFLGAILFFLTYLHLERIMAVGRKVIYARFLAFDMRQVKRNTYSKGKLTLYFPKGSMYVRLPVTDMNETMTLLTRSGRKR